MNSMRRGVQAERSTAPVSSAIATKGVYVGLASAAAFGSLATRPRAEQAVENAFPGATTEGRARFWRIGGALLLVLLLAVLLFAAPADAQPRIKNHSEVYATNYVDPIAFTDHLHRHFGHTSPTNASTGESLKANHSTSCDAP